MLMPEHVEIFFSSKMEKSTHHPNLGKDGEVPPKHAPKPARIGSLAPAPRQSDARVSAPSLSRELPQQAGDLWRSNYTFYTVADEDARNRLRLGNERRAGDE